LELEALDYWDPMGLAVAMRLLGSIDDSESLLAKLARHDPELSLKLVQELT
jgi:hypothetical protein